MITGMDASSDSQVRKISITYKNTGENVFRESKRSIRTKVVINRVNDVDLMNEIQI